MVLTQGTTFDIMVHDVMVAWENHKQEKASGKLTPPEVSEETLLEIMRKAKG